MILVKENIIKQRSVYKLDDRIRKVYGGITLEHVKEHAAIMEKVYPNYIINYGKCSEGVFLECKILPGIPCNQIEFTLDNISKVYNFCLRNICFTYPYMHMDWAPSNILCDGENFYMVDWDNVCIQSPKIALDELDIDMKECYGSKFDLFIEHLGDDFSSIRAPVLSIGAPVDYLF